MVAIMTTPDLNKCDNASILQAIYECAVLQLLPDGKRAALVVRRSKTSSTGHSVSAQPMVRGIVELLHRSGEVKSLVVELVYEGDGFVYEIDSESEHGVVLKHALDTTGKPRTWATLTKAYAILKTLKGASHIAVMEKREIEAAKKMSKTIGQYVWTGPFWAETVKKTVLHRLPKHTPVSYTHLTLPTICSV